MANVAAAPSRDVTIPTTAATAPSSSAPTKNIRAEVLELMKDVCARTKRLADLIEARQAARVAAKGQP